MKSFQNHYHRVYSKMEKIPFIIDKKRYQSANGEHHQLIQKLNDQLLWENDGLLSALSKCTTPQDFIERIAMIDISIQPLDIHEWPDEQHEDILLLVDKGWFHLSITDSLYPRSMAQLYFEYMCENGYQKEADQIFSFMRLDKPPAGWIP